MSAPELRTEEEIVRDISRVEAAHAAGLYWTAKELEDATKVEDYDCLLSLVINHAIHLKRLRKACRALTCRDGELS